MILDHEKLHVRYKCQLTYTLMYIKLITALHCLNGLDIHVTLSSGRIKRITTIYKVSMGLWIPDLSRKIDDFADPVRLIILS